MRAKMGGDLCTKELVLLMNVALLYCLFTSASTINNEWTDAHATFYGDMHGAETMQGACGYGDLFKQGYGLETTALSTALFNDGKTCGACYEIQCHNDEKWCLNGTIHVTATNFCPPNYSKPDENWCNPPLKHFDLSEPMFLKVAKYKAGIVPVLYRRIPCVKSGGIKFEIKGNPYWILVLVYNVGGAGDVINVKIKGSRTDWIQMSRNWGQNWQTSAQLLGQSLSFQVTTSDGNMVQSDDVVSADWKFGDVYEGKNFPSGSNASKLRTTCANSKHVSILHRSDVNMLI